MKRKWPWSEARGLHGGIGRQMRGVLHQSPDLLRFLPLVRNLKPGRRRAMETLQPNSSQVFFPQTQQMPDLLYLQFADQLLSPKCAPATNQDNVSLNHRRLTSEHYIRSIDLELAEKSNGKHPIT